MNSQQIWKWKTLNTFVKDPDATDAEMTQLAEEPVQSPQRQRHQDDDTFVVEGHEPIILSQQQGSTSDVIDVQMDFGAIRTPARSQNCQRPTSASQQRKTPVSSTRVTFESTANRFFSPSKRQALTAAARSQEQLYGTFNEMPERLSSISHAMRSETAHGIRQKPISEETRTSEFYQRRTVTPHKLKKNTEKIFMETSMALITVRTMMQ